MKDLIRKTWLKFFEERSRRERLQKTAISMVLIAAVVSATVYVAVTPAHTLEAEASLSCGKEEHVHAEGCFMEQALLTCGLEESAEEHTHTEECYGAESVLTCTLEEHSHGEECYTQVAETPLVETEEETDMPGTQAPEETGKPEDTVIPEEETEKELPEEKEEEATPSEVEEATPSEAPEATPSEPEGDVEYSVTLSDGLVITMTGPADAFPEGTLTMRAMELQEGDEGFEAASRLLSGETEGEIVLEQRIFDICLLDEDGNEVQPQKEVKVTFSQVLNGEEQGVQIHHLDTEANVVESIDTFVDGGDVSMETGHFSYYSVTLAGGGVATIGEKSYKTLTEAVKAVKNEETIVLQQDIEGESITISSTTCKNATMFTIDINGHTWTGKKNDLLTISKKGITVTLTSGEEGGMLEAVNGKRVITANLDCRVNVENLRLQGNGQSANAGILGSIPSSGLGATVYISNCEFTGGNAIKDGGAIYIKNGNLTAENCTFKENISVNSGTIFVWGYSSDCSASFTNCHFLKNKVGNSSRGGGGAITIASQGTKAVNLNINSCEFTENISEKDGGAIYFNSEKGKLMIAANTIFSKNSAQRNGGAVCFDKGILEVDETRFQENNAGTETGTNVSCGGGLYVKYNSDIRNTVFEKNQAGKGGAIGVSLTKSNQQLKLENVTVDGNNAGNMGGAICDESGVTSTLEVRDCNIQNNIAGYTAGGIYSTSKNIFIVGKTIIKENVAEGDVNKTSDSTKKIIGGLYLNGGSPVSFKLEETSYVYKNKTQNESVIGSDKPAEIYLYAAKGVKLEGVFGELEKGAEGNTITDSGSDYTLAKCESIT